MSRIKGAGEGDYYTLIEDDGTEVKLPRVTTVIGDILAKPILVEWAYRQTKDAISGLTAIMVQSGQTREWIEVLMDIDDLEEWLKNNRMRPRDVKFDAAERGTAAHAVLELLADAYLHEDEDTAQAVARRVLASDEASGWERGVARWWLDVLPHVLMSEERLFSERYHFAGTVDLIWQPEPGRTRITDLKSREAGRGAYDSDHVQTGAYEIAYTEMHPGVTVSSRSVLIVDSNGEWKEYDSSKYSTDIFLNLLSTYNLLKEVKNA